MAADRPDVCVCVCVVFVDGWYVVLWVKRLFFWPSLSSSCLPGNMYMSSNIDQSILDYSSRNGPHDKQPEEEVALGKKMGHQAHIELIYAK